MTAIIACLIAGLSTTAFLTLWFVISYQELFRKKQGVVAATEQVQMHRNLFKKVYGSPDEQTAKRMLDTSNLIYVEAVKCYNNTLNKAVFRFPGLVMGFRLISEKEA